MTQEITDNLNPLEIQKVINALPFAVITICKDGNLIAANKKWKQVCCNECNYPLERKPIGEVFSPALRDEIFYLIQNATLHKQDCQSEIAFTDDQGKRHIHQLYISPISNTHDVLQYFVITAREIDKNQAIDDLGKIDHLKSNFLAMISHELRTPLTSIRGAVHVIGNKQDPAAPVPYDPFISIIHSNTERLIRLVNNLLDMVTIDNETFAISPQPHCLGRLALECAEKYEKIAQSKLITFHSQTETCDAYIDTERVRQVLEHLLDNAIKFTPPRGEVSLKVATSGDIVRVVVSDTGPGVRDDAKETIFKRFTQEADTMTRGTGGTGIGLFLARCIIEKHNGRLYVETNTQGGADFILDLPKHLTN